MSARTPTTVPETVEQAEQRQIEEALRRLRERQPQREPRWRLPAGLTEAELLAGYERPMAQAEAS